MGIRSEVERITPEIAERLLDASKEQVRNRKVADSHVEWLADQMKSAKWRTNGEPLILDDEGYLLDGQHRLYAVILSGVTIETVVTRGVDRTSFATIDTGAVRKTSDVLGISNEANSIVLASALGWLHRYEQGKMLWALKSTGFTSSIALGLLKKNGGLRDMVTWGCSYTRSNLILGKVSVSSLAFLKYVFSTYKPQKAEEFFELVGETRPDHHGTPTRVLRDWIIKDERSRNPATSLETIAIFVKAWTAFLSEATPMTYVWRRTGPTPESFPKFPGEKESRGKAIRGMERKGGKAKTRREE